MMGYACKTFERLTWEAPSTVPAREVAVAGIFLAFLQAADGILTSLGVTRFGLSAEGNPFLRHLMLEYGHLATLAVMKVAAILIVCALMVLARRVPWVKDMLNVVCSVYLFAAILPWTYILFIQPHLHLLY